MNIATGVSTRCCHVHRIGRYGAPEQIGPRRPPALRRSIPPLDVRRPTRQIHSRVNQKQNLFNFLKYKKKNYQQKMLNKKN